MTDGSAEHPNDVLCRVVELRGFEPLTFSLRTTPIHPCTHVSHLASNACKRWNATHCKTGVRGGYACATAMGLERVASVRSEFGRDGRTKVSSGARLAPLTGGLTITG